MKILIVDDEPFALKILAHQLRQLGHEDVVTCDRARDGLQIVQAAPQAVELLFCDLQMPELDGVSFVRELVHVGYKNGLVLVSGEDERVLQTATRLARAHALDVLGALKKPVTPDQLRALISTQRQPVRSELTTRRAYGADEVRHGVAARELTNYYQPQVELASGAVVAVETLARWQHPTDGLVSPDQFIPTAEQSGLIADLTQVVLFDALRQARRWRDGGFGFRIAVNVSMQNLVSLDFPDAVHDLASDARVPLSALVLEVTESCLMEDPMTAWDVLTRLRLKQIGLSIDDFGTGHSSLAQLRDVPFDELKIDRSFVSGAAEQRSQRVILEASLGMARELGLRTVGEGVESLADWRYLRQVDCTLAQGYFIAPPMRPADFEAWLTRWDERLLELYGA